MVALLFWEPRRGRVVAIKVAVLTGAVALLALLAEGGWLLAARVLAATRGPLRPEVLPGLWHSLFGSAGRGLLLAVLAGLIGFGVANLVRNTAAALGVGFVYFAIMETVVRALRPTWQQWLVTDNAVALVARGGIHIDTDSAYISQNGQYVPDGREIALSNLHGGLFLAAATGVLLVVGAVLFARRDLN